MYYALFKEDMIIKTRALDKNYTFGDQLERWNWANMG